MKHSIILVHSKKQEGLYIDNILVHQDKKILPMNMLLYIQLYLPGDVQIHNLLPDVWYVDEEWFKEVKIFPNSFEDVKVRF